jgi:hypothetical protein
MFRQRLLISIIVETGLFLLVLMDVCFLLCDLKHNSFCKTSHVTVRFVLCLHGEDHAACSVEQKFHQFATSLMLCMVNISVMSLKKFILNYD